MALMIMSVEGITTLRTDSDCTTCLTAGTFVCRDKNPLTTSAYCCTADERNSTHADANAFCISGTDIFCTDEYTSDGMKPFACPYSADYCGSSSS